MLLQRLLGYFYIALGLFLMLHFAGKLLLELLAIIFGIILIFKGFFALAFNRAIYYYSAHYFKDQFKL